METSATMAIERAQSHKEGANNLTWGTYVSDAANGRLPVIMSNNATPAAVKKASGKASKVK